VQRRAHYNQAKAIKQALAIYPTWRPSIYHVIFSLEKCPGQQK
jgi:hypothetical protein